MQGKNNNNNTNNSKNRKDRKKGEKMAHSRTQLKMLKLFFPVTLLPSDKD